MSEERIQSSTDPGTEQKASEGRPRDFLNQRLVSLDVYRGLIMITLAFTGFGLAETAARHVKAGDASALWQQVGYQFEHTEWVGCSYWDLIQPSFMFMVGVALPFSYGRREQQHASYAMMLRHAIWRSLILIFLGIFLISNGRSSTNWSLMNVLTQIGLGYTFLFLLRGQGLLRQVLTAAGLLVGTWLLYVLYPYSGIDLSQGAPDLGVSASWAQAHLAGVGAAWHKNANVGHAIDRWLLNLFPTAEPFVYNKGGYQTINFIPSLATMIFGLMAGELLRSSRSSGRKLLALLVWGSAGLLVGWGLDRMGICPLVKRIWTPSWALFSAGWCALFLAGFFGIADVLGWRGWTFPLVVVGVNSIAIYCMGQLLKSWVRGTYKTHLGPDIFLTAGRLNEPLLMACLTGLAFWLACWYMYRHRIFIRI
jgi:heparan-alpha-glucosaminide N-acetyltransferase